MLAALLYDLKVEQCKIGELNDEFLFGKEKNGTGWEHMAWARMQLQNFLRSVATKSRASEACQAALVDLSPLALVPKLEPSPPSDEVDKTADKTVAAYEEEVLKKAKEAMPAKEHQLLDVFHSCIAGEFSEALAKIALESKGDATAVVRMVEKDTTSMGKSIDSAMKALEDKAVQSEVAVPALTGRALIRLGSNDDEAERVLRAQKERKEVWEKAIAVREKYCTLHNLSDLPSPPKTGAELKQLLLDTRSQNEGVSLELNAKHRAVIFSADLVGPMTSFTHGALTTDATKTLAMLASCIKELGCRESELHMMFDGKSRECRRVLEDALSKRPSTECVELWVSYQKAAACRVKQANKGLKDLCYV